MKTVFRLLPYLYMFLASLVLVSLVFVLKGIITLFQNNVHPTPDARALATLIVFLLIAVALLAVYTLNAIFLLRKAKRKASIILAVISCIGFPFGTILGVISLFVLTRKEIKGEYA